MSSKTRTRFQDGLCPSQFSLKNKDILDYSLGTFNLIYTKNDENKIKIREICKRVLDVYRLNAGNDVIINGCKVLEFNDDTYCLIFYIGTNHMRDREKNLKEVKELGGILGSFINYSNQKGSFNFKYFKNHLDRDTYKIECLSDLVSGVVNYVFD